MRSTIQAFLLMAAMLAVPGFANTYDSMPTPVPGPVPDAGKSHDEKAQVKRGTHWYRKPNYPTIQEQMAFASKLLEKGRYRKAANAYQALVYAWPDSPEAVKAQLALAQVQELRQLYTTAFDEYQYLFDYYPGQFDYQLVLDRQFKIANYLMTTPKGSFLFFHGFQDPERAIPLFEKITRNAPTWVNAPTAQLNIGIIHETNKDYEEAVAAYELLQNRYTDDNLLPQASFREARCLYKIYKDNPNNEEACNSARFAVTQFMRLYPRHAQIEEAQAFLQTLNTEQAKRLYGQARYYDRIAHRPKAALIVYDEFLRKYSMSAPELAEIAKSRVDSLKQEVKNHEKK